MSDTRWTPRRRRRRPQRGVLLGGPAVVLGKFFAVEITSGRRPSLIQKRLAYLATLGGHDEDEIVNPALAEALVPWPPEREER